MTTTSAPEKRITAKTTPVEIEPIAAAVNVSRVKKRTVKKAGPTAHATNRNRAKESEALILDPFDEVARLTAPVKKSAAKTVESGPKAPKKAAKKLVKKRTLNPADEIASPAPQVGLSPAFIALSEPVLPRLKRENRARLQMQSPTKLYFYWSARENPWSILRNAFGGETLGYSLVLKLTNLQTGTEQVQPAEAEGDHWFDVEPGGEYEAEIGFYAPNRPYFRIIHSNTVETPRRNPSPRPATDSEWTVSADKFAEVLDVAGFSRDAFDVALAGDDPGAAEDAAHAAFARLVGTSEYSFDGIGAEDIRYAILALASGRKLVDLRRAISPALLAILQANADKLEAGKAWSALTESFDVDEAGFAEEQAGSAVYGASLVNFPQTLKTRGLSPRETVVSGR